MIKLRQPQIGIIGPAGVQNTTLIMIAKNLGNAIATNKAILLFGFEGDLKSFSEIAARSCLKNGGKTVAFLWGGQKITDNYLKNFINISTGLERGGGREFVFIRSCDAVIAVNGGSGVLTEISIAYQMSIPVITLKYSGGWGNKLANTYLDGRKKVLIQESDDEASAVRLAINCAKI